jgi:hypothetical protein
LDSRTGPGSHWITIYNSNPTECLYFDPFGVDPPEELLNLMRHTGKKIIMNKYRIQEISSKSCGVYCIYVIDALNDRKRFIDILTDFDPADYLSNESIIAHI